MRLWLRRPGTHLSTGLNGIRITLRNSSRRWCEACVIEAGMVMAQARVRVQRLIAVQGLATADKLAGFLAAMDLSACTLKVGVVKHL